MPLADTPAAEVEVNTALVSELLAEQHPDLAGLPLSHLAAGWDNVLFRLGDDLVVRLPRRAVAAPLVDNELRWLPGLAPRLPLPVPVPLRAGRPSPTYPWSWSIGPWLEGEPALRCPPHDPAAAAATLGSFLAALHKAAPPDAPRNPFRGVPLAARAELVRQRVEQLHDIVDGPAVWALWQRLAETPAWQGPAVWVHGDVHPGNLLVRDGRLSAVIDFGDLCQGDPASDFAVGWMCFDGARRAVLRAAAGNIDDATWARARAWALALGVAILAGSADEAAMAQLGRDTIARALAG